LNAYIAPFLPAKLPRLLIRLYPPNAYLKKSSFDWSSGGVKTSARLAVWNNSATLSKVKIIGLSHNHLPLQVIPILISSSQNFEL